MCLYACLSVWMCPWSPRSRHWYVIQVDEDNVACQRAVTATVTVRTVHCAFMGTLYGVLCVIVWTKSWNTEACL